MDIKSFDVIYQELYENIGKELEAKIKKHMINFFKLLGIIVFFIVIIYIFGNIELLSLCIIAGCLISIFSLFKIQELKLKYYREEIITYLVKGCNLNYDYKFGLKEDEYINSKIPEKFDAFCSKDYIYGKIKGTVGFKLSYVNTYRKEKYIVDGQEKIEKIETFKGIFGVADINKNINAEVIIDLNDFKRKYRLNKVELDSIQFEKNFDCFSNNKIVALQILTPDVLEQINNLSEIIKKTIQIRIYNNQIFYRFYLEDIFLPPKFKNILEKNSLKRIYNVINNSEMLVECISEIVDENF